MYLYALCPWKYGKKRELRAASSSCAPDSFRTTVYSTTYLKPSPTSHVRGLSNQMIA